MAWRVQELLQLHVTLEPLMDLAILMASLADEERSVKLLTLVGGVASIDRRTESKAERLLTEQAAAPLLA